jgi:hypothetical protein
VIANSLQYISHFFTANTHSGLIERQGRQDTRFLAVSLGVLGDLAVYFWHLYGREIANKQKAQDKSCGTCNARFILRCDIEKPYGGGR